MTNTGKKFRSKYLSLLLRHDPAKENLVLDDYGWCYVDTLITRLGITKYDLDKIVSENNKQRFRYNEDQTLIKANQGHSIKIKDDFKQKKPPLELFHGTTIDNKKSIKKSGLKKMRRNHVHLSEEICTAKDVGMRYAKYQNKLIILVIDSIKMNDDGYKFYLSDNGVWLTDYVPSKYISI